MNATIREMVIDAAPSMVKTMIIIAAVINAIETVAERDPEYREANVHVLKGVAMVIQKMLDDVGIPMEEREAMAAQVDREWAMRRVMETL